MLQSMFVESVEPPLPALAADADLVRRISGAAPGAASSEEAELCRRLAGRIRLYGLRHLRDEQAAADLTQQVLLLTLEALRGGRLRDPGKLVSFVLGACRMTVLDLRRNAGRRRDLLDRFGGDLPHASFAEPPRIEEKRLASCLQRLSERDRTVVVMTFYDERSSEDVGSFLGLSPANVRVIRHRALGRLRDCLQLSGGQS